MDTCISFLGVSLVQHIQPMMLAGYAVVTAGSPKKLHSVLQELLIDSNDSRTKGLMGEIWEKNGEDLLLSIFAVHFAVHGGFGTADLSFRKD